MRQDEVMEGDAATTAHSPEGAITRSTNDGLAEAEQRGKELVGAHMKHVSLPGSAVSCGAPHAQAAAGGLGRGGAVRRIILRVRVGRWRGRCTAVAICIGRRIALCGPLL